MPRTQKEPVPAQPRAANGTGEVMDLAEAAALLRVPEEDVVAAAASQGLPGRMIGGEWRFAKAGLLQWLGVSQPTDEMRKAAQMAAAGSLEDDPDIEDIVEEIYRKRGRPITEDGSYRLFHELNPEDFKK